MYIVCSIKLFFSPTCSCLSGFKWLCLHRRDGGETPLPPPHRLATPTWATGKSRWIRCTPTSTCCSSSRGCCWTPRRSGSSADTLGKKNQKKKHSRHTQSSPSPPRQILWKWVTRFKWLNSKSPHSAPLQKLITAAEQSGFSSGRLDELMAGRCVGCW